MIKLDQLIIGNVSSYDDYEASVKERAVSQPKKKSIKESVPFSNKTYDFSKINGEVYWEERTLEYVFEITADSPEELEEKKLGFLSWIMNVFEEEIYDPFIEDYHFFGSYEDMEVDDSEIEKSTITVTFKVYPYKIANAKKSQSFSVSKTKEITAKISNDSSHRVVPTFTSNVDFTLTLQNQSFALSAGTTTYHGIYLEVGINEIVIQATKNGTVKVEFEEEVF